MGKRKLAVRKHVTDEQMDKIRDLLSSLPLRRLEEAQSHISGLVKVARTVRDKEKKDD